MKEENGLPRAQSALAMTPLQEACGAGGQSRPPLRMGYKGHGRRADVGIGPYGWVSRGAVERVVGDADPYARLQEVR